MQLPLEAVDEYQISTQRFSAENGRSEGAAINMITKPGTNSSTVRLFGYFRDIRSGPRMKSMPTARAARFRTNPDYSRQYFGGSIGGPSRKTRLFVFFAIERERESQGLTETGPVLHQLVVAQAEMACG